MKRLWIPNFDFEYQLNSASFHSSQKLLAIQRPLIPKLLPLMKAGDGLWLGDHYQNEKNADIEAPIRTNGMIPVWSEAELPAGLEVIPWGWTERLISWAAQKNWRVNAPQINSVRLANSRKISSQLEQKWECGPLEIFCFDDLYRLEKQLSETAAAQKWVIKAEFSMSSRERILGQGAFLNPSHRAWLQKRLSQSQALVWEPWLQKIAECSFHYQIDADGTVCFLGQVGLLTDVYGRYLHNDSLPVQKSESYKSTSVDLDWSYSQIMTRKAAQSLADRGYFGPLGIDSMIYTALDGEIKQRPLQDINARWTMGRVAWEQVANL